MTVWAALTREPPIFIIAPAFLSLKAVSGSSCSAVLPAATATHHVLLNATNGQLGGEACGELSGKPCIEAALEADD